MLLINAGHDQVGVWLQKAMFSLPRIPMDSTGAQESETYNNNVLQLGCKAVVILHVDKTLYCLLLNLIREGYMRSM